MTFIRRSNIECLLARCQLVCYIPYVCYPHSNSADTVLSPALNLSELGNLPKVTGIGSDDSSESDQAFSLPPDVRVEITSCVIISCAQPSYALFSFLPPFLLSFCKNNTYLVFIKKIFFTIIINHFLKNFN